jgi:hypothetical protein
MPCAVKPYTSRQPEQTILYQVLAENLAAFRQSVDDQGKRLPEYVEQELSDFLACGRLEHGFIRLKCGDCGHEKLLAFSCKRRGFCPSCCGRRMNEAEKRLVEAVFPHVPVRQWVLSLPVPLRFFCSRNRFLINELTRIFSRAVESKLRKVMRRRGLRKPRSGGVLYIQRLGGALNLNVHFHAVFLDGAFDAEGRDRRPNFSGLAEDLTSADIADVVQKIAAASIKALKTADLLEDEQRHEKDPDGIELCDGASVKSKVAFGERAGLPVRRIRLSQKDAKPRILGELVAEMNGFNLKADGSVKAHQRWKLARLIRYIARPPVATDRLVLTADGQSVRYLLKNPWSDGTTEILLSGVELVEKLAAAVPPPRGHLVRYLGVLAPNSTLRRLVVPNPKPKARDHSGKLRLNATQKAAWAELAKHSFDVDLTVCEHCGGKVRRISVIRDPLVIAKILTHISRTRPPPVGHEAVSKIESI